MAFRLSRMEDVLGHFRAMVPAESRTAQAIDNGKPVDEIAAIAVSEGYIESTDQFMRLVEACVRSR